MGEIFRVTVNGNLVVAVERLPERPEDCSMLSNLDTAKRLAAAFQSCGNVDGCYDFPTLPAARVFAQLCLEFVRAVAERRLADLSRLPAGATYRAGDGGP